MTKKSKFEFTQKKKKLYKGLSTLLELIAETSFAADGNKAIRARCYFWLKEK